MKQFHYLLRTTVLLCLMLTICLPQIQAQDTPHQAAVQGDPPSISDVFIFNIGDKKGLKQRSSGVEILPAVYDGIWKVGVRGDVFKPSDYGEVLFRVKDGDKYGVFNNAGQQRLPVIYDKITSTFVVFEGKKGIVNLDGKVIVPFGYDKIQPVRRGYIIEKDSLFGLISKSGKQILEAKYPKLDNPFMTNFLYITNQKGRIWVLDMDDMQYVSKVAFDEVEIVELHDAKCRVSSSDKKKYSAFQVKKAGKVGYLKMDGTELLPIAFESIQPIIRCRDLQGFILHKDGELALASAKGEVITLKNVEQLRYLQKGLFAYSKKGKEGLMDIEGKPLTKPKYDYISYFGNITTRVELNGKQGIIGVDGELVSPIDQPIQRNGYTNLEELFRAFTAAIKSNDEAQMKAFAQAICIDQQSIEFMYPLQISYRGIPNKMLSQGVSVDKIYEDYFTRMTRFSNKLKLMKALDSVKYGGIEREGISMFYPQYNVQASETRILLHSDIRTFRPKLGELLLIDGVWKVFTTPKF